MKPDLIIANPPYAKIGCDIVNKIMYDVPHNDISLLGTTAMLCKHNNHLALEYVYIEGYVLNPVCKVKWVQQLILLGHKGNCKAIPSKCERHNGEIKSNEIRVPFPMARAGNIHLSWETLLTRSRVTSWIISVPDEDYEYIKEHWGKMNAIQRFWWFHDHGLYKRFIEQ